VSYSMDTNCFDDTGELNKLTMREKYKGRDQIHRRMDKV
jgi:hypothetical protein